MNSNLKNLSEIINTQYETTLINPKEPLNDAVTMYPDNESSNENINKKNINNISFDIEDVKDEMGQLLETSSSGLNQFPSIFFLKSVENSY